MDCSTSGRKYREYRCCTLAHIWHHAFPIARGLSRHACRAHDSTTATPEFLPEEPRAGCAAELLFDPKSEGKSFEEGRGEQRRQGESGRVIRCNMCMAMVLLRCKYTSFLSQFERALGPLDLVYHAELTFNFALRLHHKCRLVAVGAALPQCKRQPMSERNGRSYERSVLHGCRICTLLLEPLTSSKVLERRVGIYRNECS